MENENKVNIIRKRMELQTKHLSEWTREDQETLKLFYVHFTSSQEAMEWLIKETFPSINEVIEHLLRYRKGNK